MNVFLKYIEDGKIGEHIYGVVLDYCNKHRTLVLEHVSDYGFSYINEVNDIYPIFKTIWINEKGDTSIDFDIVLEVDMDCTGVCGKRHDHENCSANMWILVSYTGDLKKKLEDFKIKSIEEYNDKTLMDSPLTGDFLPPMKKENYDDYARIILEKFCPEALTKPMEIDNLMTKEYSRQKFVANVYPVLALTRESMMGDDNHYRCYKDSVIIDNISYYISSQWIEDSREDLINYYLERRNRSDNEQ